MFCVLTEKEKLIEQLNNRLHLALAAAALLQPFSATHSIHSDLYPWLAAAVSSIRIVVLV